MVIEQPQCKSMMANHLNTEVMFNSSSGREIQQKCFIRKKKNLCNFWKSSDSLEVEGHTWR